MTRNFVLTKLKLVVMQLLYALGLGLLLSAGFISGGSSESDSEDSIAIGAVVTDHEACSRIGRRMLERHGTAVDATIAALICNGVRTPHSMGIGGGSFMVVYDKSSRTAVAINGRESAPGRMTQDLFANLTAENVKARVIGVPGELKAYKLAHSMYGRLPWRDLFQPTIEMLREGFPLAASTAKAMQFLVDIGIQLTDFPLLCEIFCSNTATGTPKQEGDTIYRPKLLKTLEGVADNGPEYLYDSPVTVDIVNEIKEIGGVLEVSDFTTDYQVLIENAMKFDLGDYYLYTMGGASGGPVVGLISNILEGFNFCGDDLSSTDKKIEAYHKIIEATKFAFADRALLGDPEFVDMFELLNKMQSDEYAVYLRNHIDEVETHDVGYYTNIAADYIGLEGTSHVSVLSPKGDAVSVTSTINYYFGSRIVSNSTGIIWNNEMLDFALTPEVLIKERESWKLKQKVLTNAAIIKKRVYATSPNLVEPGKRPRSSMSPTIIVKKSTGQAKLITGAAGGSKIITTVSQIIARTLVMNQDIEAATNEKRFYHPLFGNELLVEKGFPEIIARTLLMNQDIEAATNEKRFYHPLFGNELLVEKGFPEDILAGLNNTKKHIVAMDSRDFMGVAESIMIDESGIIKGVADQRKRPGKTSYMYEIDDPESDLME